MSHKIVQLVCSHKTIDEFDGRTVIYVSKNVDKDTSNGIITWENDNIDLLNPYYCELTALYWFWKNSFDYDYISFEHYRRKFLSNDLGITKYYLLSQKKIDRILSKKKIILPRIHHFKPTLYEDYKANHYISDLEVLKDILSKTNPDYLDSYDKVLFGHEAYLCNMFVMSKEDFNSYMSFAMPILDSLFMIQKEDILTRDTYQQRSIGFVAERLFNIWVNKNFNKNDIYNCHVGYLNQNHFIHKLKNFIFFVLRKNYNK